MKLVNNAKLRNVCPSSKVIHIIPLLQDLLPFVKKCVIFGFVRICQIFATAGASVFPQDTFLVSIIPVTIKLHGTYPHSILLWRNQNNDILVYLLSRVLFTGTHCMLGRLAPVLKTIFHQCVLSYTCSQSNCDGSVLKQSHHS